MKLTGGQISGLLKKRENERVTGDVKIPFKIADDGITRIDDTPVHKALREVLANALIHADYHGRRGIVVEKHFRTITFSNPGTMRISKSVAVAGGTSDARNTAIFNIFALVDIGERSGMGLANLHGLWKKYGYAEPKITESYDPDRTIITVTTDDDTVSDTVIGLKPDQNPTKSTPEMVQKQSESGAEQQIRIKDPTRTRPEPEQNPTRTRPEILGELPSSCRQVFESIVEDNKVTYRAMVSKLSLNKDTVNEQRGNCKTPSFGVISRVEHVETFRISTRSTCSTWLNRMFCNFLQRYREYGRGDVDKAWIITSCRTQEGRTLGDCGGA